MELDRQKPVIIIVSAVAIVVIAVYLFLYKPLITELRAAYAEFKRYDSEISRARGVIAAAKKIDTKKVFITERAMITEEDISRAIAELTGQEKLQEINFVSITPGDVEKQKDPRYKILPIAIKAESTYEKLGTFLGLLDDMEEGVVTLGSFKIVPDKGNPAILKADLVLNLYLSSEDAE